MHAGDPGRRVLDLGGLRERLRRLPHPVEAVDADGVDDVPDERCSVAVLAHLGLQPEQAAQHPVDRADPLAPLVEPAADRGHRRDHLRPDLVHDDVGVALQQRHDGRDLGQLGPLLGGGDDVDEPGAAAAEGLRKLRRQAGQRVLQRLRVGHEVGGQGADALDEVVAQPRHGSELHAMGLLVHAHPEPEVRGVDTELPLDLHEVGRDEHEPGRALGREVVLAQHLPGHEREQRTGLTAGDLAADGAGGGTGGALLGVRDLPEHRVHEGGHRVGVERDPGGPVDDDRRGCVTRCVEAGRVGDGLLGAAGRGPDVGHDLGGLTGRDLRPGRYQPPAGRLGELPVDELRPRSLHAHCLHRSDF